MWLKRNTISTTFLHLFPNDIWFKVIFAMIADDINSSCSLWNAIGDVVCLTDLHYTGWLWMTAAADITVWARLGCSAHSMMTSSDGNIFRVTGHLCGEFNGYRWIPSKKACDAEFWCFLWQQWWCWWFETPSCPLWRHCNGLAWITIFL